MMSKHELCDNKVFNWVKILDSNRLLEIEQSQFLVLNESSLSLD